ncbi:RNA polymerase sporulation sigma factor SigH [Lachnospiraceae bacterium NSJ-143]|nr:RNA polymerase sporulation sigma factor SigH [Lachnospiraceae bacterium NSJ-143]
MTEDEFEKLNDEEIIVLVRTGDQEAQDYILNKYKTMVKSKARAYFLMGADREDIIQEGMIGLYKAVRDYQPGKNTAFKSFADLCINRQIITAIKTASRQKHIPLNSSVSLNRQVYGSDEEETYMDFLKTEETTSPEAIFIGIENKNFIVEHFSKVLSGFESKVLNLYLQGKSYSKIAEITGKPEKSIDNALQRVKKKTEKFINQAET